MEPLIDVIEGRMYTGQSLDNLIRHIREKLDSNVPAEEFKVSTSSSIPLSLLRKTLLNIRLCSKLRFCLSGWVTSLTIFPFPHALCLNLILRH